ncbi:MAG: nucleotide sugar dehydrogenase [Thermomicrobiales bacterium]|nr:nucleotide sugar dehydrogenase [Thermomicrobiales bacterium]
MNIAVVGLGHIGLPLAALYAAKGFRVRGCDINPAVVDMVNAGEGYEDEDRLDDLVESVVGSGLLSAEATTTRAVASSDVVVVIVPLIVDGDKRVDYRSIDAATRDIAAGLQPGALVIYETTLPVGDTRHRFGKLLQEGSGLVPGSDFSLAFSPERVYVGRVFDDLAKYPKIVGGIDGESTVRAAEFYEAVLDAPIMQVENAETAEFCKLAETTYRDVNIALANEFACFAEEKGIDVLQAIDAANTQPFSHIHRPGIGVGGHCIPVYPYFYANATDYASIARLARGINDDMAAYAVGRLEAELGGLEACTVGILGYAYRENVKEDAFTVAARLIQLLRARGAAVVVHDPHFTRHELIRKRLVPFEPDDPPRLDALVLQAAHREYEDLDFLRFEGLRVVVDGRNAVAPERLPPSVRYLGIGRGATRSEIAEPQSPAVSEQDESVVQADGAVV